MLTDIIMPLGGMGNPRRSYTLIHPGLTMAISHSIRDYKYCTKRCCYDYPTLANHEPTQLQGICMISGFKCINGHAKCNNFS